MAWQSSGNPWWILVFVLIFGIPFFAIHYGNKKLAKYRPRVRSLMEDYGNALSEGRYDEAWGKYTTDSFKKKISLEKFKSELQGNVARSGAMKLEVALVKGGYTIGHGFGFDVFVNLYFGRYSQHWQYFAATQPDGGLLLDYVNPWTRYAGTDIER